MGTKTASPPGAAAPRARPSPRARRAYFGVGTAAELVLIGVSLILDWSDSALLSFTFVLVIVYVPIATPLLFWRSMKPAH